MISEQEIQEKTDQIESKIRGGNQHLQKKIFDEENSFEKIEDAWSDLVQKTESTVYATPEWVKTWWKYFGKNSNRSIFILTLWDDETLIGIAPFYQGVTKILGKPIEKRLQLIGSGGSPSEQLGYKDDYGVSDFLDFIVHPDYEFFAADIFADWLYTISKEYASITFHQVRDDSFIFRQLYPKLKSYPIFLNAIVTDTCPYIVLGGLQSLKEYVPTVKSNARRRLRQTLRAMNEDQYFTIEEAKTPEEIAKATDTLIKMHQERWNEMGYPGLFYDHRFTAFFKELLEISYNNKWLWFKETIDEEGVNSSRMILKYNGRFYDYVSGFDNSSPASKYRPGFGLLLNLIEDAFANNINRIELLRGEEGYKFDFTDKTLKNWMITIQNKNGGQKPSKAFAVIANIYKHGSRESRLLHVHSKMHGIVNGIISYTKFRFERVKHKMVKSDK